MTPNLAADYAKLSKKVVELGKEVTLGTLTKSVSTNETAVALSKVDQGIGTTEAKCPARSYRGSHKLRKHCRTQKYERSVASHFILISATPLVRSVESKI